MKKVIVFSLAILAIIIIGITTPHYRRPYTQPNPGPDRTVYDFGPPLPDHIKVGPYIYTIEENGAIEYNSELGMMTCDKLKIFISAGLPISKKREVVMHEIAHTAFCPLQMQVASDEKFSQEQAVYLEAPQIVMVLRDNPDLVRFLTR